MKKLFQLHLLLSCLLIFLSHHISDVDDVDGVDAWTAGHQFEESFNDTDNHDLDGAITKAAIFTASILPTEQKFFFESKNKRIRLTHGVIRAPPKYTFS